MPTIEGQELSFEDYIARMKAEITRQIVARQPSESGATAEPSKMWHQALATHRYLLSLSAEDLRLVRYHTSFLTGHNVYDFWHPYPPWEPQPFAEYNGYEFLIQGLPEEFHISEPPIQGARPIGLNYKGKWLNFDTFRFQHIVSALATSNILSVLDSPIPTFCEIGPGYGGLAYSIWRALKGRVRYFLVDFPEIFMFSGSYLGLNVPEARFEFSQDGVISQANATAEEVEPGFYFVPSHSPLLNDRIRSLDIGCNMLSFQEMTPEQIRNYIRFFDDSTAKFLIVDNFDCHPYNEALRASGLIVPQLVDERFDLYPSYGVYDRASGSKHHYYDKLFLGISRKHAEMVERWWATAPFLRKNWKGKSLEIKQAPEP